MTVKEFEEISKEIKTERDDNMLKYSVYECHEYSESECVMSNITYEEAKAYCENMFTESDDWDTWYEIVIED